MWFRFYLVALACAWSWQGTAKAQTEPQPETPSAEPAPVEPTIEVEEIQSAPVEPETPTEPESIPVEPETLTAPEPLPVEPEVVAEPEPSLVDIHAFISQGFILTSGSNYLAESKRGSFEFTEIGINFTKTLTDQLNVGLQLFTRDLGPIGDYEARMDWFYLDYRFRDWLGFRAGRVKLPFGLYNEFNDADSARVPILLPQSIYPIQNRDFLLAQTGAEIYGYFNLSGAGALDYRIYGGTIFLPITNQPGAPFEVGDVKIPYVVGGRLLWETPLEGLRAGGSLQALKLDTDLFYTDTTTNMTTAVNVKIPAILWVASLEYAAYDLLLSAEYSRWHVKSESSDNAVFPSAPTITSERAFCMAAYHVTPWLQPGVYYSLIFPNIDDRSGRDAIQHDVAGTLRFDINDYWLVKLEGHYMNGTVALNPVINDNTPRSDMQRNWGVFLVKTTAYF